MKLSRPNYREAFASRIRHDRLQRTHVVVGDHEPEPRIDWDAGRLGTFHDMEMQPDYVASGHVRSPVPPPYMSGLQIQKRYDQ